MMLNPIWIFAGSLLYRNLSEWWIFASNQYAVVRGRAPCPMRTPDYAWLSFMDILAGSPAETNHELFTIGEETDPDEAI